MVTREEALVVDRIAYYAGNMLFDEWRLERDFHKAHCQKYVVPPHTGPFVIGGCSCHTVGEWNTWVAGQVLTSAMLNEYHRRTYPELKEDIYG